MKLPGNYQIKTLQLRSDIGYKIVDLIPLYTEINIFESIYSSCVTGYITISDALNIISGSENALPIMGNEIIYMELELPAYFYEESEGKWSKPIDNFVNFIGRITDIKNRSLDSSERTQSYELHFSSDELVIDRNYKISKSYKNKSIWEMAKNIFDELKPVCTTLYEKTLYNYSFIIPNWHPIKAINWLASRSISAEYNTSSYFFFQTFYSDGETDTESQNFHLDYKDKLWQKYWFVSLDYLLKWEPRKTIFFVPSNQMKPNINNPKSYMMFSNALNYKIVHSFDILESNYFGLFNSKVISHDITKKQWKENKYSYDDSFSNFNHTNKDKTGKLFDGVVNYENQRFSDYTDSLHIYIPTGSYEAPNRLNNIISENMSRIQSLNFFKLQIIIPGDGLIESGDIINFKYPSPEEDGQNKYDRFYDGNYLVTAIRHKFSTDYSMTLECSKESLKIDAKDYSPKNV